MTDLLFGILILILILPVIQDSLSLSPRNHPAWDEAATRFHKGLLDTIFIECSYDSCQPDKALFGHLSPPHLLGELQVMAERVVVLRAQEEKERREKLKRKRMNQGLEDIVTENLASFSDSGRDYDYEPKGLGIVYQTGRKNGDRRCSKSSRHAPKVDLKNDMDYDENYLSPTSQSSPGAMADGEVAHNELDLFNMAVGQRTPEPTTPPDLDSLPSLASIPVGLLEHGPLTGLHLVITHVKDTLEDDVDVAGNILTSLEMLEMDRKLGCTFSLSEQGSTFYF